MSGSGGTRNIAVYFIGFGAAMAAAETLLNRAQVDGSFLFILTCWTMLIQGCVALAAVGEIAKGHWLFPIKRDLLSFYPLLFFTALIYPLIALRFEIYNWTAHPTAWLNVKFFIARNVALLLMCAFVAHKLARAVMAHSPKKNTYAVYYVLLFVASESLIAFDWIMSLEYPWISTLFGGYFFIQAFLMGLLMSAFILFSKSRQGVKGLGDTSHDAGKMIFGFCFVWGGFFYSQYLPIWYGNIPEEISYVVKRVSPGPYWMLSRVVFLMVFLIPFATLLSRKVKRVPPAMAGLAAMILTGLCLEKVVLINPVVPVRPLFVAVDAVILGILTVAVYRMRESFMPQLVAEAAPKHSHAGAHASHHR